MLTGHEWRPHSGSAWLRPSALTKFNPADDTAKAHKSRGKTFVRALEEANQALANGAMPEEFLAVEDTRPLDIPDEPAPATAAATGGAGAAGAAAGSPESAGKRGRKRGSAADTPEAKVRDCRLRTCAIPPGLTRSPGRVSFWSTACTRDPGAQDPHPAAPRPDGPRGRHRVGVTRCACLPCAIVQFWPKIASRPSPTPSSTLAPSRAAAAWAGWAPASTRSCRGSQTWPARSRPLSCHTPLRPCTRTHKRRQTLSAPKCPRVALITQSRLKTVPW